MAKGGGEMKRLEQWEYKGINQRCENGMEERRGRTAGSRYGAGRGGWGMGDKVEEEAAEGGGVGHILT